MVVEYFITLVEYQRPQVRCESALTIRFLSLTKQPLEGTRPSNGSRDPPNSHQRARSEGTMGTPGFLVAEPGGSDAGLHRALALIADSP
jgi:hypothetical protein